MSNVSVRTGDPVPIEVVPLTDKTDGSLVTGSTAVKAKIRREFDGKVYDWSDDTFKDVGSVSQLLQSLSEVDATNFAGEYNLIFDTGNVMNPSPADTYHITVVEDGSSAIGNLPQSGNIRVEPALDDATLSRKFLGNNQELQEGSSNNLEVKDDDNATTLQVWNIKDKNGTGITLGTAVPAIRERV